MPNGLPRNKPKIIPKLSGEVRLVNEEPEMYKLVFANAKMGIIKNPTGR